MQLGYSKRSSGNQLEYGHSVKKGAVERIVKREGFINIPKAHVSAHMYGIR